MLSSSLLSSRSRSRPARVRRPSTTSGNGHFSGRPSWLCFGCTSCSTPKERAAATLACILLGSLFLLWIGNPFYLNSTALNPPVRFLSIGDWGRNGTCNQTLLADQMGILGAKYNVQFVTSTGDNFYKHGLPDTSATQFSESFTDVYTAPSLRVPWYTVLGNHDYYGNVLAELDPELTRRDSRWNCARSMKLSKSLCRPMNAASMMARPLFRQLNQEALCPSSHRLDIFMYDTTPLVKEYRTKVNEQLDWRGLNSSHWQGQEEEQLQELEGWLRSSVAKWKIVIGHHPVYSYGPHGHQPEIIEGVKPLLEKYGVDVYMNGHDHNIQHIKMQDSPVHYFTSGGGSKAWKAGFPNGDTPGLQRYWPGQGFGVVSVGVHIMNIEFFGVFGDLLHSVTLKK